jgi:outer membrane protein TolC
MSSFGLAQSARVLTLDEAIRIGKDQSKTMKASSMKVEAASAKASETKTALFPSLKLEAGYKRLSDVDPFQVSLPIFPTPVTISPVVLDNYNLKVSLQQPLFTGFRLRSNARAAELSATAAEFDHRSDEADLVLNIKSAYWMLYQTLEVKKLVDENVNRLDTHVKDTEALMNAGIATRNDLLKIQVQRSNARLTQIDAAHDVQVAMMSLNNIIGQPLDTEVQLASAPTEGANGQGTLPRDLIQKAFTSRPDLQSMQYRVKSGEASVTAAKGNWWPQLFFTGSYFYNRPNARYQPTRDEFKSTWELGVQLQFDLWNWGATGFQSEQAMTQLHQTEYLYDQMKDNISLEVTRYQLQVQRSNEKIEVAKTAIAEAEENARSTSDKYKNGLATSSDLLDADVALLQAKTNLTGALIEHEIAQARLARAVGE